MSEPNFNGVKFAIQRLKPLCPDCGRECHFPNFKRADGQGVKPLNELSDCDRTRQHQMTCVCGTTFMARFYEHQEREK